ncbi:MAG TPA: S16 family serine protease, partial [Thermoanaerobaculia bacterium]|nr:S16 family serine protease [Thermoanaerobaculia bacterium]
IPKDGPSAGVAMASAIVSALSKRPCRRDVAMTGEVTLSGRVLPIGGVKEKLLGAVRAGIRTVVLPKENVPDLEDLPQDVRDGLEIVPVQDLSEALAVSLRGHVKDGQLLFTDEAASGAKQVPAEP